MSEGFGIIDRDGLIRRPPTEMAISAKRHGSGVSRRVPFRDREPRDDEEP